MRREQTFDIRSHTEPAIDKQNIREKRNVILKLFCWSCWTKLKASFINPN